MKINFDYGVANFDGGLINSDGTHNLHNIPTLDKVIGDISQIQVLLSKHNISIKEMKLSTEIMESKDSINPVKSNL